MDDLKFDLEFEKEILSQAIVDVEHHFGTSEYSWCWKIIFNVWTKYKELPTKKLFVQKAKNDFSDSEEKIKNLKVANSLFEHKSKNPKSSLEELQKFVQFVNVQKAMENSVQKLNNNDIDGAYSEFSKLTKVDLSDSNYTRIKWIEGFEERQKERKYFRDHPELIVSVPTGIKKLDRIITGIQVGELGLVMATTSQGKSAMLTNFAYAALINQIRKYKVAYFALEMPARQIAMRQDARWLKMDYDKFKKYDFTRKERKYIEKKLKTAKQRMEGRFEIFSCPLGKPTIQIVKQILEDSFNDCGFRPDLILLDSPDHMQPIKRQDSIRLNHTTTYQEIKAFAEEDGYAIWASTHAGRDWAKKIATAEASGESYDKSRIADIVLSLNTPERKTRSTKITIDDDDEDFIDDPTTLAKHRYIELFLAKYRDGKARLSIPLDGEFSKMMFHELEV
jgi:hypothetical protein